MNKPINKSKVKKTKTNLLKTDFRKIPKSVLKETLEILKNPESVVWMDRNATCATGIHNSGQNESINLKLLNYSRDCLIRRDWLNLAKILALSNPSGLRSNTYLFQLCAKYATICLAHKDKTLLESYLQSVHSTDNCEEIIKQCTSF